MNLNKLTPEQMGVLKGSLGTSAVFSIGIAIGAFFLHRKHEEELDKLERDTARVCLDIATEQYEKVLYGNKRKEVFTSAASQTESIVPPEGKEDTLRGSNVMNKSAEDARCNVDALSKRLDRLKKRHETLMNEFEARDVIFSAELERIKSKIVGN